MSSQGNITNLITISQGVYKSEVAYQEVLFRRCMLQNFSTTLSSVFTSRDLHSSPHNHTLVLVYSITSTQIYSLTPHHHHNTHTHNITFESQGLFSESDLFEIWLIQLALFETEPFQLDSFTSRPFGMSNSNKEKQPWHIVKVIWAKLTYSKSSTGKPLF